MCSASPPRPSLPRRSTYSARVAVELFVAKKTCQLGGRRPLAAQERLRRRKERRGIFEPGKVTDAGEPQDTRIFDERAPQSRGIGEDQILETVHDQRWCADVPRAIAEVPGAAERGVDPLHQARERGRPLVGQSAGIGLGPQHRLRPAELPRPAQPAMLAAVGDAITPLTVAVLGLEAFHGLGIDALALASECHVELALQLCREDGRRAEVAHRRRADEQQPLDLVRVIRGVQPSDQPISEKRSRPRWPRIASMSSNSLANVTGTSAGIGSERPRPLRS